MVRLSAEEVQRRLKPLKGWRRSGKEIVKRFTFPSFKEAIALVNRVAALAEAANHHPDILVKYDRVVLTLTTHDEGGLTHRDFDLAAKINKL